MIFSYNFSGVNAQTTAKIAKELLRVGNSPTADALAKQEHNHRTGNYLLIYPSTDQRSLNLV